MKSPATLLAVEGSPRAALPRPQRGSAFDWWYADARDAAGSGLVFIWANRLPFFESDEPAVSLALYDRGKPGFWLLQHHPRIAWHAEGSRVRLGRSSLEIAPEAGGLRLRAELDLALPGEKRRLTGVIDTCSVTPALGPAPEGHGHRWAPLGPTAVLSASLRLGGSALFDYQGPGYFDRNLAESDLKSLGIERWWWGRARSGDRCITFYLLEGGGRREGWLLRAGPGASELSQLPADQQGFAGGLLRLGGVEVDLGRAVERGPFYARYFGTLTEGGAAWPLIAERCEVSRIGALRPLVRMRTHRPAGGDSLWAPLFGGARQGRALRMLRRLAGGRP